MIPSTPTARNQDTPSDSRKPHTRPTQAHHMHNTVHAATQCLHTTNFGPQAIYLLPNSTNTTIARPITQTINKPIFSNQEHQTPASQETEKFLANSLPTPSQQRLVEDIVAQSTPPRRRRRLQSQAIRNASTNYLVHSQANPLESQANADVQRESPL